MARCYIHNGQRIQGSPPSDERTRRAIDEIIRAAQSVAIGLHGEKTMKPKPETTHPQQAKLTSAFGAFGYCVHEECEADLQAGQPHKPECPTQQTQKEPKP